jgi:predicted  nucleic acid-binding Zn-ribbon protein
MSRRRKRGRRGKVRKPPRSYSASPAELRERARNPMTGFVCGSCGWIYIQGGRSGRKACPKCRGLVLRRYVGASIDGLAETLIPAEAAHEDPIGNKALIRRRFAEAFERLNRRKDEWRSAEGIASSIVGEEPSRALVAKVHRDCKAKPPGERERKQRRRASKDSRSGRMAGPMGRPSLESLEHERREEERRRVRGLKKGPVRKKFL